MSIGRDEYVQEQRSVRLNFAANGLALAECLKIDNKEEEVLQAATRVLWRLLDIVSISAKISRVEMLERIGLNLEEEEEQEEPSLFWLPQRDDGRINYLLVDRSRRIENLSRTVAAVIREDLILNMSVRMIFAPNEMYEYLRKNKERQVDNLTFCAERLMFAVAGCSEANGVSFLQVARSERAV